jgi:hypothetical protein
MTDRLTQSSQNGTRTPDTMRDAMTNAMDGTTAIEQQFHLVEHGVHIAVMVLVLVLVVLGIVFLVRFFLKPISSQALNSSLYARALGAFKEPFGQKGRHSEVAQDGREKDTFLVIPDISGYTRFIELNRFSAGHAQYVVSELLHAIINAAKPTLKPKGVEGDAVVFYAFSQSGDPGRGVTGAQVGLATVNLLNAFYRRRAELKHDNACHCEACSHIDDLHLKVVLHRGPVVHYILDNFEDLSGFSVIAAYRLLKNSLGLDRYILLTEAAGEEIELPLVVEKDRHTERYDDIGEITFRVYGFEPSPEDSAHGASRHGPIAARTRDAVRKLAENARTLGKAIGASA